MKACDEPVSDGACSDKYAFCPKTINLNVKCQAERFRQICCKACRDTDSAAKRPKMSQWTLYRQRLLKKAKKN
ncbi:hypothetical protein C0Q70_01660 [Pomacea canaliculata]|uniref:PLAC domain-containing protein n=1 Tax=Pomacea canaliculata TaxID=400727 RepID=A0A2T7Q034_POMCA|nr:hypothetical protein C0Q70_01660 [Pomacea canaliculata]